MLTISPAIGNFFFIGYEAIVVLFLVRTVHLDRARSALLLALVGFGAIIGAAIARPIGAPDRHVARALGSHGRDRRRSRC